MVVLFTGAALTVVATVLVAFQQARQEERFAELSARLLGSDDPRGQ